jgi:hypothetical protein
MAEREGLTQVFLGTGPKGDTGAPGKACTVLHQQFIQPGAGVPVQVSVKGTDEGWGGTDWTAAGAAVTIDGDVYEVQTVDAHKLMTLVLLTDVADLQTAPGGIMIAGLKVVAGGKGLKGDPGVDGADGADGLADPPTVVRVAATTTAPIERNVLILVEDPSGPMNVYLELGEPGQQDGDVVRVKFVSNAGNFPVVVDDVASSGKVDGGVDTLTLVNQAREYRYDAEGETWKIQAGWPTGTSEEDVYYFYKARENLTDPTDVIEMDVGHRREVWVIGTDAVDVSDQNSVMLKWSQRDDVMDGDEVTVVLKGTIPADDRWIGVFVEEVDDDADTPDTLVGDTTETQYATYTYTPSAVVKTGAVFQMREPAMAVTFKLDKANQRWVITHRNRQDHILFKQVAHQMGVDIAPPSTGITGAGGSFSTTNKSYKVTATLHSYSTLGPINQADVVGQLVAIPQDSLIDVMVTAVGRTDAVVQDGNDVILRGAVLDRRRRFYSDGDVYAQGDLIEGANDFRGASATDWDVYIESNGGSDISIMTVCDPAYRIRWTFDVMVIVRVGGQHGGEA